jgi:hypothetical protein
MMIQSGNILLRAHDASVIPRDTDIPGASGIIPPRYSFSTLNAV